MAQPSKAERARLERLRLSAAPSPEATRAARRAAAGIGPTARRLPRVPTRTPTRFRRPSSRTGGVVPSPVSSTTKPTAVPPPKPDLGSWESRAVQFIDLANTAMSSFLNRLTGIEFDPKKPPTEEYQFNVENVVNSTRQFVGGFLNTWLPNLNPNLESQAVRARAASTAAARSDALAKERLIRAGVPENQIVIRTAVDAQRITERFQIDAKNALQGAGDVFGMAGEAWWHFMMLGLEPLETVTKAAYITTLTSMTDDIGQATDMLEAHYVTRQLEEPIQLDMTVPDENFLPALRENWDRWRQGLDKKTQETAEMSLTIATMEQLDKQFETGEIFFSILGHQFSETPMSEIISDVSRVNSGEMDGETFDRKYENIWWELAGFFAVMGVKPVGELVGTTFKYGVPLGPAIRAAEKGILRVPIVRNLLRQSQRAVETKIRDAGRQAFGTMERRRGGRPLHEAFSDYYVGDMEMRASLAAQERGFLDDLLGWIRTHWGEDFAKELTSPIPEVRHQAARVYLSRFATQEGELIAVERLHPIIRADLASRAAISTYRAAHGIEAETVSGVWGTIKQAAPFLKQLWLTWSPRFAFVNPISVVIRTSLDHGIAPSLEFLRDLMFPWARRFLRGPLERFRWETASERAIKLTDQLGLNLPRDLIRGVGTAEMGEGFTELMISRWLWPVGKLKYAQGTRIWQWAGKFLPAGVRESWKKWMKKNMSRTWEYMEPVLQDVPEGAIEMGRMQRFLSTGLSVGSFGEGIWKHWHHAVEREARSLAFRYHAEPLISSFKHVEFPNVAREYLLGTGRYKEETIETWITDISALDIHPSQLLEFLGQVTKPSRRLPMGWLLGKPPNNMPGEIAPTLAQFRVWADNPTTMETGIKILNDARNQVGKRTRDSLDSFSMDDPGSYLYQLMHQPGFDDPAIIAWIGPEVMAQRSAAASIRRRAYADIGAFDRAGLGLAEEAGIKLSPAELNDLHMRIAMKMENEVRRPFIELKNARRLRYQTEIRRATDETAKAQLKVEMYRDLDKIFEDELRAQVSYLEGEGAAETAKFYVEQIAAGGEGRITYTQSEIRNRIGKLQDELRANDKRLIREIYAQEETSLEYLDALQGRVEQLYGTGKIEFSPEEIVTASEELIAARLGRASTAGRKGNIQRQLNQARKDMAAVRERLTVKGKGIPSEAEPIVQEASNKVFRLEIELREAGIEFEAAGTRLGQAHEGRQAIEGFYRTEGEGMAFPDKQAVAEMYTQGVYDIMRDGVVYSNTLHIDYSTTNEFLQILRKYTPFPLWPIKSIQWLGESFWRHPKFWAGMRFFADETTYQNHLRGIPQSWATSVPLPGQEYLKEQGILKEDFYYAWNPTALLDIWGQIPIFSGRDLFNYDEEPWYGKIIRSGEFVGLGGQWPWVEGGLDMIGVGLNMPARDLWQWSTFFKYKWGIDIERPIHDIRRVIENFLPFKEVLGLPEDPYGQRLDIRNDILYWFTGITLTNWTAKAMEEGEYIIVPPEYIEQFREYYAQVVASPGSVTPDVREAMEWLNQHYSDPEILERGELVDENRTRMAQGSGARGGLPNLLDPLWAYAMDTTRKEQWGRAVWGALTPFVHRSFGPGELAARGGREMMDTFETTEEFKEWLDTPDGKAWQAYPGRYSRNATAPELLDDLSNDLYADEFFDWQNQEREDRVADIEKDIRMKPEQVPLILSKLYGLHSFLQPDHEFNLPSNYSKFNSDQEMRDQIGRNAIGFFLSGRPDRSSFYLPDGTFLREEFDEAEEEWVDSVLDGTHERWQHAVVRTAWGIKTENVAYAEERLRNVFETEADLKRYVRRYDSPKMAGYRITRNEYLSEAQEAFGDALDVEGSGARSLTIEEVYEKYDGAFLTDYIREILEAYPARDWTRADLQEELAGLRFPGLKEYFRYAIGEDWEIREEAWSMFHEARRTAGFADRILLWRDEYRANDGADAKRAWRSANPKRWQALKAYDDFFDSYRDTYEDFDAVVRGDYTPPAKTSDPRLDEPPFDFLTTVEEEEGILEWMISNPGSYTEAFVAWKAMTEDEHSEMLRRYPKTEEMFETLARWHIGGPTEVLFDRIVRYARDAGVNVSSVIRKIEEPKVRSAVYDILGDLDAREGQKEEADNIVARETIKRSGGRARASGRGTVPPVDPSMTWDWFMANAGALAEDVGRVFSGSGELTPAMLEYLRKIHAAHYSGVTFEAFLEMLRASWMGSGEVGRGIPLRRRSYLLRPQL